MLSKNNLISVLFFLGITISCFSQDLIPYRINDKWGFADSNGKIVHKVMYDSVEAYEFNRVMKKYGSVVYKGDRSFFVDKSNISIFDTNFKNIIVDNYYNLIFAKDNNNKFRLFKTSSNKFGDLLFDTYSENSFFLIVENDNKVGIIDKQSNLVIPIEYDQITYKALYNSDETLEYIEKNKTNEFNLKISNRRIYLNGQEISYEDPIIIASVINDKETKNVLKVLSYYDIDSDEDNEIEVPFSTSRDYFHKLSQKTGLEIIECDSEEKHCIFKDNEKYALYNKKTKKKSTFFDKVEFIYNNAKAFKVSINDKYGVIDENYEIIMPIIYETIKPDYESYYIFHGTKQDENSINSYDYKYDYFNLKSKKQIIKDCDFFYSSYVRKSSKNGIYYFAVKKDGIVFYVNENGIEYIQKL